MNLFSHCWKQERENKIQLLSSPLNVVSQGEMFMSLKHNMSHLDFVVQAINLALVCHQVETDRLLCGRCF